MNLKLDPKMIEKIEEAVGQTDSLLAWRLGLTLLARILEELEQLPVRIARETHPKAQAERSR